MRMHYIDHLRAVCMVFVVVLHAYYLIDYQPAALFAVFIYNFCMGTFFIISGYVMGQTLSSEHVANHLKGRVKRLAWPLATGLLIVNPVTLAVIHGSFGTVWAEDVWDRALSGRLFVHLWFLFCLIGFVCAVPALLKLIKSERFCAVFCSIGRRLPTRYWATGITIGAVGVQMMVAGTIGIDITIPFNGLVTYAWTFVLGLALAFSPRAWEAIHKPGLLPFVIAGFFWLAMIDGWSEHGTRWHEMLHAARLASSTAAISFALLWAFRRFFDAPTRLWAILSEGALTTYVLQWLVLHLLLAPLTALGLQGGALFIALIVCTLGIKMTVHHQIVKRSAFLSLLLNGTPMHEAARHRPQALAN